MRVVAGTARSIPLKSRDGLDTRPTADRVKEAIFNILQFDVPGAEVLDLFGGSGQLAIEALSRGASHAVIVDRSPEALAVIRENLERTKLADRAEVIRADYQEYLRRCGRQFSIILLDPPYRENFLENALKQISEIDILKTGGIIVCEKPVEKGLDPAYGGIRHAKDYRYGKTMISVYRAAAPFDGQ
ncbi:MAG: 16S rRNA (guanine(966)-N(2))-methyltransferase RsmD [Oscillospiraceae bacterium]|nr:16S rRNA (guanine(966)-N(2))-methyltransferase RsmD [Oscillospiraceae bacterium]